MNGRTVIPAGLAIPGIALPGFWLFAPSVTTEVCGRLDGDRFEGLVARARFLGPVLIVTLMGRRHRQPHPERADC